MKCPKCGRKHSRVRDSRHVRGDTAIKRRRHCPSRNCKHRWTTFEIGTMAFQRLQKLTARLEQEVGVIGKAE